MPMNSKSIRSFAGGIIIATAICAIAYFLTPGDPATSETVNNNSAENEPAANEGTANNQAGEGAEAEQPEPPTDEEMLNLLTAKGYVIHSAEQWQQHLAETEAARVSAEEAARKSAEEASGNVVYRTMLSVSSGMTSIDVGRALQQVNIIANAQEFTNVVESRGLANALRPGMYQVESGMSMDEIIAMMFKQ
ncbi:hypothetical protein J9303_07130 [Bacillaceae bacterium Marseille-Q3522]|nr:hypothetical protein [Bacillaceae bacterium Marseille-Q3522]